MSSSVATVAWVLLLVVGAVAVWVWMTSWAVRRLAPRAGLPTMIERIGRWTPANSSESRYSAAVTLVGAALGPIALTIRLRQSVAGEFATLGTLALVAGILLSIIWALILIVALSRRRPPDS